MAEPKLSSGRPRGTIIGALAAVASLSAVLVSAIALRQTAANNDRELHGQLAARFDAAVQEISNPSSVASRQGGIISMEHVMKEDDSWRPSVVEIISAFVRDYRNPNSPHMPPRGSASNQRTDRRCAAAPPRVVAVRHPSPRLSRPTGAAGWARASAQTARRLQFDSPLLRAVHSGPGRVAYRRR